MLKKSIGVNLLISALLVSAMTLCLFGQSSLWPPTSPYQTGFLKVSDIHEIYYQLGGTPEGKPVIFLHGGPGGGCTPNYFRFFNPEKFHIILHDQRGCGLSKPNSELKGNTTQHLVQDIEKLRNHLKLGKVILFGGSWGSTLALAYAETYPENVAGMVLRGIFTSTSEEIDYFYHGGAGAFFPDAYEKLVKLLPHPEKKNYPAQLLEKLVSKDPAVREKYAAAWTAYELKLAFLDMPEQRLERILTFIKPKIYAFALLESHYMANNCFLEEDQLLKNAGKLRGIPLIMVNGRYDAICPPKNAFRLHRLLPGSKLVITGKAGHSASEPETEKQLVEAVKTFE